MIETVSFPAKPTSHIQYTEVKSDTIRLEGRYGCSIPTLSSLPYTLSTAIKVTQSGNKRDVVGTESAFRKNPPPIDPATYCMSLVCYLPYITLPYPQSSFL